MILPRSWTMVPMPASRAGTMAPRFLALVVLCFPSSAYDQRDAKLQEIVYAHYEIQAEAKGQGSPKETTNATAPAHSAKGAHSVEGGAFEQGAWMWGANAWVVLERQALLAGLEVADLERRGLGEGVVEAFADVSEKAWKALETLTAKHASFERVYKFITRATASRPEADRVADWKGSSQHRDGGWHEYHRDSITASGKSTTGDYDPTTTALTPEDYAAVVALSSGRE